MDTESVVYDEPVEMTADNAAPDESSMLSNAEEDIEMKANYAYV